MPNQSTSALGAGKEVSAYCGKCQLKLAHIIVTMKGPQLPGRVQCKTCQATHLYKETPMAGSTTLTRRKVSSKKSSKKDTRSNEEVWTSALSDAKNKQQSQKSYSISENFAVGDVIDHASFGKGVVQSLMSGDKIEVIFQEQIKTLVHNKN